MCLCVCVSDCLSFFGFRLDATVSRVMGVMHPWLAEVCYPPPGYVPLSLMEGRPFFWVKPSDQLFSTLLLWTQKCDRSKYAMDSVSLSLSFAAGNGKSHQGWSLKIHNVVNVVFHTYTEATWSINKLPSLKILGIRCSRILVAHVEVAEFDHIAHTAGLIDHQNWPPKCRDVK